MKVYLAGPMTGIESWNFPAFDAAAEWLRGCGYTVVNPADLDRQAGFDGDCTAVSPTFLREAMGRDLAAICGCDGVAVLEGWQASLGACIEVALAVRLGLRILDAETLEELTEDIGEFIRWKML